MDRLLYSVEGNRQRLDGGAMFGNAPKAVWERWAPADTANRIDLACRALLVRELGPKPRWILFETGIGAFFEPKLKERFGVFEDRHVLLDGLARIGILDADIDVVVLSHLHFDHAGGLLSAWADGQPPKLLFPRATFVVGHEAFRRARAPHFRDRASFIPELPGLLEASGRLEIVEGERSKALGESYPLRFSDGHTPGLLLSEVPGASGPILFASDLVPGAAWLRRAITMGYDRFPERLIEEKSALLAELAARRGRIYFTHDPRVAMARLEAGEKQEVVVADAVEALHGAPA